MKDTESVFSKDWMKKNGKFNARKEEDWNKRNTVAGCQLVLKSK